MLERAINILEDIIRTKNYTNLELLLAELQYLKSRQVPIDYLKGGLHDHGCVKYLTNVSD